MFVGGEQALGNQSGDGQAAHRTQKFAAAQVVVVMHVKNPPVG